MQPKEAREQSKDLYSEYAAVGLGNGSETALPHCSKVTVTQTILDTAPGGGGIWAPAFWVSGCIV